MWFSYYYYYYYIIPIPITITIIIMNLHIEILSLPLDIHNSLSIGLSDFMSKSSDVTSQRETERRSHQSLIGNIQHSLTRLNELQRYVWMYMYMYVWMDGDGDGDNSNRITRMT